MLGTSLGVLDSDEAVTGLMGRHTTFQGEPSLLFWGQNYGGTMEATYLGVLLRVFGSSVGTMKAGMILLSMAACVSVAYFGRRFVGPRAAAYAAATTFVASANFVWWSTKAAGFYWSTLILEMAIIWTAAGAVDEPNSRRRWMLLGLLGGLSWWNSPQSLYVAVPVVIWLVWKLRSRLVLAWPAVPAALVGAFPWILAHIRNPGLPLTYERETSGGYLDRLRLFFEAVLPRVTGLPERHGSLLDELVYPAVAVLVFVAVALLAWRRRHAHQSLLLLSILSYPLVFASFPTSFYVKDGRYLLALAPVVWLVVAGKVARVMPVLPVGLLLVSALGMPAARDRFQPGVFGVPIPNDSSPLIKFLGRHRVEAATANYWVSYRITFESDEKVIVTPDDPTLVRNREMNRFVQRRRPSVFITVRGAPDISRASATRPHRYSVDGWVVLSSDPIAS